MRFLKPFLVLAALTTGIGGCYVESHPAPYYSSGYYHHGRYCAQGYYWDGYRCRHY